VLLPAPLTPGKMLRKPSASPDVQLEYIRGERNALRVSLASIQINDDSHILRLLRLCVCIRYLVVR
jgi:hypothetical protein